MFAQQMYLHSDVPSTVRVDGRKHKPKPPSFPSTRTFEATRQMGTEGEATECNRLPLEQRHCHWDGCMLGAAVNARVRRCCVGRNRHFFRSLAVFRLFAECCKVWEMEGRSIVPPSNS